MFQKKMKQKVKTEVWPLTENIQIKNIYMEFHVTSVE